MNWLAWLALAVVITGGAAVTAIQPKGTRPVGHTRLMGMARLALVAFAGILFYMAYLARSG